MSPATAAKVFPISSIFTSYSNKQQQQYQSTSKAKSRSRYTTTTSTKLIKSITAESDDAVVLTVWKKSLLMNCNGFTVYDGKGNLVFRVDNYVAGNRGEIVLMDVTGKPLLTIRRKISLSLTDYWTIHDGAGDKTVNPKFCFQKNPNRFNSKTLAHVTTTTTSSQSSPKKNTLIYEIEGSYTQRSVSVYDTTRRCVAEIRRKEAPGGISLGDDVFTLVVSSSQIDTATAMGFVILLEQMFGSSSSSSSHSSWTTRRYSP